MPDSAPAAALIRETAPSKMPTSNVAALGDAPASPSPQDRPVTFRNKSGEMLGAVKVDLAQGKGRSITVSGWATSACKVELLSGTAPLLAQLERGRRPDVAAALKLDEPVAGFGFTFQARHPGPELPDDLSLRVLLQAGRRTQTFDYPLVVDREVADVAVAASSAADALGFIEGAACCSLSGDLVVVGWVAHAQGVRVWLENDSGEELALGDAYRFFRQDVSDVHGGRFGLASREAGFIVRLAGTARTSRLRLMAALDGRGIELAQTTVSRLGLDPVAAARWLFGLHSPMRQMPDRVAKVDMPLLENLVQHHRSAWQALPVQHQRLGVQVDDPLVSVVVPLFGRSDFVEHQLIEFCRDPWFVQHAELIYVIDDPRLLEPFAAQAEQLHRLYRLPFSWVWGGINRGFSGANNLGAAHGHAPCLLFMNSDVFPLKSGWLEPLVQVLEERADVGAVCPRLLFADGSIQHAGMCFLRREELGIWVNHHPLMGLPPALDPHQELTFLPAVTGACMLMRRADYERVGGWDTGYLIGDFEDSEMCLKLRAAGLETAYLPNVELTHLERQSFKTMGQDDFRQRVVIYNAVRHQQRWGPQIAQLSGAGAGAA